MVEIGSNLMYTLLAPLTLTQAANTPIQVPSHFPITHRCNPIVLSPVTPDVMQKYQNHIRECWTMRLTPKTGLLMVHTLIASVQLTLEI